MSIESLFSTASISPDQVLRQMGKNLFSPPRLSIPQTILDLPPSSTIGPIKKTIRFILHKKPAAMTTATSLVATATTNIMTAVTPTATTTAHVATAATNIMTAVTPTATTTAHVATAATNITAAATPIATASAALPQISTVWNGFIEGAIPAIKAAISAIKTEPKLQMGLFVLGLFGFLYFSSRGTKLRNVAIKVQADPNEKRSYELTAGNGAVIQLTIKPGKPVKVAISRPTGQEPTLYHISVETSGSKGDREPITFDLGNNQVVQLVDNRC